MSDSARIDGSILYLPKPIHYCCPPTSIRGRRSKSPAPKNYGKFCILTDFRPDSLLHS